MDRLIEFLNKYNDFWELTEVKKLKEFEFEHRMNEWIEFRRPLTERSQYQAFFTRCLHLSFHSTASVLIECSDFYIYHKKGTYNVMDREDKRLSILKNKVRQI